MTLINNGNSDGPTEAFHGLSSDGWAMNEAKMILGLSIPTMIIQLGFTMPQAITASYVGRNFGSAHMDGYQLSILTLNLFTLTLLQGLFTANDTLSPQAYGAGNYSEVGYIAMRSVIACAAVITPICLAIFFALKPGLLALGEDEGASEYASQWYRVYVFSLPFYIIYNATWKFLSAQNVMTPLVVACLVSCCIVLPLGLFFMAGQFGYVGTAFAMFAYQFAQPAILLLYLWYLKPFKSECWPGLGLWRKCLSVDSFKIYFFLGCGGMIASSEWIYWEALSLAIGTLGVVPLSVHTVATQVVTVSFMIPFGIGIAVAIRIGATISHSVKKAQQLTLATFLAGLAFICLMSLTFYFARASLIRLFTSDEDVIEACNQLWWKVCFFLVQLGTFALNLGVSTGLGMQWTLGIVTLVILWFISFPGAWYFGIYKAHSLEVVWDWIVPPYAGINILLIISFVTADWHMISNEVRKREGLSDEGKVATNGQNYGTIGQGEHESLLAVS